MPLVSNEAEKWMTPSKPVSPSKLPLSFFWKCWRGYDHFCLSAPFCLPINRGVGPSKRLNKTSSGLSSSSFVCSCSNKVTSTPPPNSLPPLYWSCPAIIRLLHYQWGAAPWHPGSCLRSQLEIQREVKVHWFAVTFKLLKVGSGVICFFFCLFFTGVVWCLPYWALR